MTVIAMSRTEIDRMSVLQDLAEEQDQGCGSRDADGAWSASGVSAGARPMPAAWPGSAGVAPKRGEAEQSCPTRRICAMR